jgi:hypothetical protein
VASPTEPSEPVTPPEPVEPVGAAKPAEPAGQVESAPGDAESAAPGEAAEPTGWVESAPGDAESGEPAGPVMMLFRREGDECVARLTPQEAQILRQSMASLAALIVDVPDRSDPAVGRLFPDVYPDDPVQQAEFRRLTEGELRAAKLTQAHGVLADLVEAGGEVRLSPERAELWLRALTDVRLALGTRLGVTDDTDIEAEIDAAVGRDPESPRVLQLTVYQYLTTLQRSLVDALIGDE